MKTPHILQVEIATPHRVRLDFGPDDYERYLKCQLESAASAIAVKLFNEMAREVKPQGFSREAEINGDVDRRAFAIAVLPPEEVDAFAAQLAEARREGMREAAALVRARANAGFELADGPCAHVIRNALHDAATVIGLKAEGEEK